MRQYSTHYALFEFDKKFDADKFWRLVMN